MWGLLQAPKLERTKEKRRERLIEVGTEEEGAANVGNAVGAEIGAEEEGAANIGETVRAEVGEAVEGEADVGDAVGAAELHSLESADILLKMVCMIEFDRRSRLAPSPLKLPLKLTA